MITIKDLIITIILSTILIFSANYFGEDGHKQEINTPVQSEENQEGKNNNPSDELSNHEIIYHQIAAGENIDNIAKIYGIDKKTILQNNDGLEEGTELTPGTEIKILPVSGILYNIKEGDSLWNISNHYDISLDDILKYNNLNDPYNIEPGTEIILPGVSNSTSVINYNEDNNKPRNPGLEKSNLQNFIQPVEGRISSPYGPRWGSFHHGIDYAVSTGTPVQATKEGAVILSEWVRGYGNTIVIEHREGVRTLYAHLDEFNVHGGQQVQQGEKIALSGNTGQSTGPHLHFEIQINGQPVDPMEYLD